MCFQNTCLTGGLFLSGSSCQRRNWGINPCNFHHAWMSGNPNPPAGLPDSFCEHDVTWFANEYKTFFYNKSIFNKNLFGSHSHFFTQFQQWFHQLAKDSHCNEYQIEMNEDTPHCNSRRKSQSLLISERWNQSEWTKQRSVVVARQQWICHDASIPVRPTIFLRFLGNSYVTHSGSVISVCRWSASNWCVC